MFQFCRHFRRARGPLGAITFATCLATGATANTESPLFQSHDTLVLTLEADFSSLRKERNESTSSYRPASLTYLTADGETRSLPLEVKTRGTSRLTRDVYQCSMPLLMLRFRGTDAAGTPFAGQRDLPLVPHCRDEGNFEQYALREYLAYRSFNLVTEKSLRVRPARISYVKTGDSPMTTRYGFFVEHFDSLARRLDAEITSGEDAALNVKKDFDLGLFYVFQFLIGNTDFAVRGSHNVLVLREPDDHIVAVAYDLDSSGAVNARYAAPDPRLHLPNVRFRQYRGFCEPTDVLRQVFAHYLERKPQFYALYDGQEGLTTHSRNKGRSYQDSFFRLLEDPRKMLEKINRSCW